MAYEIRASEDGICDARAFADTDLGDDTDVNDCENGNALFGSNFSNRIFLGVSGDITIIKTGGDSLKMTNLAAGQWHSAPAFKNIQSTGTDTGKEIVIGFCWGR